MNGMLVNMVICRLQDRGFTIADRKKDGYAMGIDGYALYKEYCLASFYLMVRCSFEPRYCYGYITTYQPGVLVLHDKAHLDGIWLDMGIPIREGDSTTGIRPPETVDEYMEQLNSQLEHILKERREYFQYLSLEGVHEQES